MCCMTKGEVLFFSYIITYKSLEDTEIDFLTSSLTSYFYLIEVFIKFLINYFTNPTSLFFLY